GLPPGVISLVNGAKEAVDTLLDHPSVRAISFVGSSAVAKYVYSRAAANGKRAQCQGGAKNPVVVLPDADMEMATRIVADSSFGCAGQRCLATSLTITVGEAGREFRDRISHVAEMRKVGYGIEPGIEMGPVITAESKQRVESLIGKGVNEGAAARKFRYEAQAGNIGINIGVAAPMAFFPFSGWKDSFFGDMHAQGRDAIEFYTEKKVVVERWPKEWSRTF